MLEKIIKDNIIEATQRIIMKIYLETSVINFLFAEDAPKKMKITQEFFNLIDEYDVFISAENLAEVYVNEGIIPKKYNNETLHIAIATIYKMDAIVSWNLTHIVKFNNKFQVKNINKRLKEKDVIICIPEEKVY